jgi:hypothetical protein
VFKRRGEGSSGGKTAGKIKTWTDDQKKPKVIPTEIQVLKMFMSLGRLRTFLLTLCFLAGRDYEIKNLKWEEVNFQQRKVTLWTNKGHGPGLYRPRPQGLVNAVNKAPTNSAA